MGGRPLIVIDKSKVKMGGRALIVIAWSNNLTWTVGH